MGAGQSRLEFHPDQSKRSRNVRLNNRKNLVIFGENTLNQLAFLLKPLSSSEEASLRVKVVYDKVHGDPVVGLATQELDLNHLNISSNQNLYVWHINKMVVKYRGEVRQLDQMIPRVESGADVTIHYIPSTRKATVTVANPGKDSLLSEAITLSDLPASGQLLPFVGAVSTGATATNFLLLESSSTDHINNSLIDITHKVLFTTNFGVINVSRDCKFITRTATQQGNGCALLPIKLISGVHRWGFLVRCDFGASLCMGLARYPFMLSEDYLKDHVKHIYRHPGLLVYRSYRGLLYQDGKQLSESLDPLGWQHGKTVLMEFIFDSSVGTLEVLRNGRSLGVAFKELSGGIFQPMIGFYAAYEKDVKLKHYYTSEATLEMTVQAKPNTPENSLEAIKSSTGSEDVGFEDSLVRGDITITENKKSLCRSKAQSGNVVCLLNKECHEDGVYRIAFIVEFDHGASTCLGVTTAKTIDSIKIASGNIYNSPNLYLYRSFQGILYLKGKEQQKKLEEFWMSGTLVEMEIKVEGNESSVSFKVNSADQGVAFSHLRPPLTPVVAFYAGMEKRVTVLHYEHVSTNPEPTVTKPVLETLQQPSLKTDSGLNDVDTLLTNAVPSQLPLLCSSQDAAVFYQWCMKCDQPNNTISLPCKHSTVCSKDLKLGVNAPTRHCVVCDQKIEQVWNILLPSSPS